MNVIHGNSAIYCNLLHVPFLAVSAPVTGCCVVCSVAQSLSQLLVWVVMIIDWMRWADFLLLSCDDWLVPLPTLALIDLLFYCISCSTCHWISEVFFNFIWHFTPIQKATFYLILSAQVTYVSIRWTGYVSPIHPLFPPLPSPPLGYFPVVY